MASFVLSFVARDCVLSDRDDYSVRVHVRRTSAESKRSALMQAVFQRIFIALTVQRAAAAKPVSSG